MCVKGAALRLWRVVLWAGLVCAAFSWVPVAQAQDAAPRILWLSSANQELPWEVELETGFKGEIRKRIPGADLHFEYLDLARFPETLHLDVFADYLERKYAPKNLDLIVTEGPGAAAFLIARSNLLKTSKRLSVQRSFKMEGLPAVSIGLDFAGAVREMQNLVSPKKVFVVGDATKRGEKLRLRYFQAALQQMNVRFDIEYLLDEPLETLLPKLSTLPKGSAIFYLLTFRDGAGHSLTPYAAAQRITKAANVPVFTHWHSLLGSGVLGGYMLSGKRVGRIVADVAVAQVLGQPWPELSDQPFGAYYDWQVAKRWGLSKQGFPAGSELINYEPPLIEMYTWQVIGTFVALMAMAFLSFVLAIVNNQRKEAVRSLEHEREMLTERVNERTRDLQESEEKYRTIFEASRVGFALCKMDGSLVECNQAYLDIIGYSEKEALSLTYWDLTPKSFEEDEARQLQSLEETGAYGPYEKVYIHKDRHKVPVLLNGTKLKGSNGEEYIWSIVQDLTERNRLEKTKREFVSTVSHELRTPLTSIRGVLGLMQGGAVGELSEEAIKLVSIANGNAEQLISLVNDILDLEKLESETMEFHMERFELGALVQAGVESNQGYSHQFDVRFHVLMPSEPLYVVGDKVRITQVLANLLSNAAKFSPTGESVEISITQDGTWGDVCVRDRGPGIADAFKNQIFERFAQEDSSDQRIKGGTGLGLSISKTIMDRHEGLIFFESLAEGGTAFHFRLHLDDGEDGESEPAQA